MEVKFFSSHPALRDYILMFAYAELSIDELFNTKFLPDNATSLTLFLNTNPTVTDHFSNNTVNHRITFAGQHSIPILYKAKETIKIINVDFLPWGAYAIFGTNQAELHNITANATQLFPRLQNYMAELETNLHDIDNCVKIIERFLLSELQEQPKKIDARIVNACKEITKNYGNIAIKDLCQKVGISHSGLTKYFTEMIGLKPKLFGRIARFTAVQNFLGENPNAGWNEIVHQFDYFDQNHFIREFKQFTGAIPKDRRQWEALFNPLSKAINEGFATNAEQMKLYRDTSLYQILHYINPEK